MAKASIKMIVQPNNSVYSGGGALLAAGSVIEFEFDPNDADSKAAAEARANRWEKRGSAIRKRSPEEIAAEEKANREAVEGPAEKDVLVNNPKKAAQK